MFVIFKNYGVIENMDAVSRIILKGVSIKMEYTNQKYCNYVYGSGDSAKEDFDSVCAQIARGDDK